MSPPSLKKPMQPNCGRGGELKQRQDRQAQCLTPAPSAEKRLAIPHPASLLFFAHYMLHMRMECVIDSSSLVSLCRCGLEEFLAKSGCKFFTVKEVFDEVVEDGLSKGLLDAAAAKKLFADEVIDIAEDFGYRGKPVDEKVVELAKKRGSMLMANDAKVLRRAVAEGLEAMNTAGFLFAVMRKGGMSKEKFKECLDRLLEKNRLSLKNAEKYLKEVS